MEELRNIVSVTVEIGLSYWKYWKSLESKELWSQILRDYIKRTTSFNGQCQIFNWYVPEDIYLEHIADFGNYPGIERVPENPEKYICRFRIHAITENYDIFGLQDEANRIPLLTEVLDDQAIEIRTSIRGRDRQLVKENPWITKRYKNKASARAVRYSLDAASIRTYGVCFEQNDQWCVFYEPSGEQQEEIAQPIILRYQEDESTTQTSAR